MSQTGLYRIQDYVTNGIISHSGLCRKQVYIAFGIMSQMGLFSIRHYVPFGIQSFVIMSFGDTYVVRVYVVGGYIAQVHALRDYDVRQNVLIKQVFLSWHSLILFFLVSI